jgi:opacity protein-like surface antigen
VDTRCDQWLFYATVGGAWADVYYTVGPRWGGAFKTNSSWVAGGGIEYAAKAHLVVRAEYLRYDLVGFTATNDAVFGGWATQTWDRLRIDVARVGVNYKF